MRILLWAPFGAGEHYWGPGTSAFRLYQQAIPADTKLILAHGFKDQKEYPEVFQEQHFISDLGNASLTKQGLFLVRAHSWLKNNSDRFDVVHGLGLYEFTFRPCIWFEQAKVPTFIKLTSLSNAVSHSRLSRLLGIAGRRNKSLNDITGYIAISNDIATSLSEQGVAAHRIQRIPNGVNTVRFAPATISDKEEIRKRLGLRNAFTVLFLGGISRRKNPWVIASAICQLKDAGIHDVALVVVGPDRSNDGYGEELKQYVRQNGLENRCHFVGHTDDPASYCKAADVFVLPSAGEGMSNALLEAMSSGLPALVTPVSGSSDILTDGENGFYIRADASDIAAKLMAYYKNPSLLTEHGRQARRNIEEKYSSRSVLDQHLTLFRSACGSHAAICADSSVGAP